LLKVVFIVVVDVDPASVRAGAFFVCQQQPLTADIKEAEF
jgi:hypothetical protein